MRKSRTKKLMAGFLALVLTFSMMIGMTTAKAEASGTFTVESAIVDGNVELTVKAVNLKQIGAVQMDVQYDQTALTYDSFRTRENVGGSYVEVGVEQPGTATIAYIDGDEASAGPEGLVLAVLVFRVNDGAQEATQVTLNLEELYAKETKGDASENRANPDNTAIREQYEDPTEVSAFVPAEPVNVPVKEEEPSTRILGDVTGDKSVDSEDARYVLEYVAGKRQLDEEQLANADVTGDVDVNSEDARYIMEYVVAKRADFN